MVRVVVQQNDEEKGAGRDDGAVDRGDDVRRDPESALEGITESDGRCEARGAGKVGASGLDGGAVPCEDMRLFRSGGFAGCRE